MPSPGLEVTFYCCLVGRGQGYWAHPTGHSQPYSKALCSADVNRETWANLYPFQWTSLKLCLFKLHTCQGVVQALLLVDHWKPSLRPAGSSLPSSNGRQYNPNLHRSWDSQSVGLSPGCPLQSPGSGAMCLGVCMIQVILVRPGRKPSLRSLPHGLGVVRRRPLYHLVRCASLFDDHIPRTRNTFRNFWIHGPAAILGIYQIISCIKHFFFL